jgi:two-component system, sensor histidine kinase and response regulator
METATIELTALRVVVAEDNPINAKVITAVLRQLGITPELAEDGLALLERMTAQPFDLVLTDISMPRLDGYEATLKIRGGEAGDAHRSVPVIAVTALASADCRETCRDVGMNGLLTKPIAKDRVRDAILGALQGGRIPFCEA